MELIEHTTEERLRREDAAKRLHVLADELTRQNQLSFVREGMQFTVGVPDDVVFRQRREHQNDDKAQVPTRANNVFGTTQLWLTPTFAGRGVSTGR
jgi:hypothetical protein